MNNGTVVSARPPINSLVRPAGLACLPSLVIVRGFEENIRPGVFASELGKTAKLRDILRELTPLSMMIRSYFCSRAGRYRRGGGGGPGPRGAAGGRRPGGVL